MDWVGRLDEEGRSRYIMICEPAKTSAAPLIVALLLEPSAEVSGLWHRAGFDQMSLETLLLE
jgi:membrane protein